VTKLLVTWLSPVPLRQPEQIRKP